MAEDKEPKVKESKQEPKGKALDLIGFSIQKVKIGDEEYTPGDIVDFPGQKKEPRADPAVVEFCDAEGGRVVVTLRSVEPSFKGQRAKVLAYSGVVVTLVEPIPEKLPGLPYIVVNNNLVHEKWAGNYSDDRDVIAKAKAEAAAR